MEGSSSGSGFTGSRISGMPKEHPHTAQYFSRDNMTLASPRESSLVAVSEDEQSNLEASV